MSDHVSRGVRRAGMAAFLFSSGSALFAQVVPSPLENAAGGNPQLSGTATYIDQVCPRLGAAVASLTADQADLYDRCRFARQSAPIDQSGAQQTLDQITPQELIAQDAVISGATQSQTSAVMGRLSAMGRFGISAGDTAMRMRPIELAELDQVGDTPSAASSALADQGRLQSFLSLSYSGGNQDRTLLESGFDIDLKSVTGGVDYRFTPTLTAGLSLGYGQTKLDFYADGGALKTRAVTVAGYALLQPSDRFDLTLLVAYSHVRYASARNINYINALEPTPVSRTASGRTHADQFEASTGGIYNIGSGAWTFGPAGQISYSHLSINAFDETGASGLNFQFPNQKAESLQFSIGGDASYAMSTNFGILSPYARVRAIFEALDKRRSIAIRYVNDPFPDSLGTVLTTSAADRDRYSLGGGWAAQFASGASAFIDAQTVLGLRDITQYSISIGGRIAF